GRSEQGECQVKSPVGKEPTVERISMTERDAKRPAAGSPVGDGTGADTPADSAEDAHFDRMLAAEAAPGARERYGPRPDQFVEWFGDPHTADTVVALIHGGYF